MDELDAGVLLLLLPLPLGEITATVVTVSGFFVAAAGFADPLGGGGASIAFNFEGSTGTHSISDCRCCCPDDTGNAWRIAFVWSTDRVGRGTEFRMFITIGPRSFKMNGWLNAFELPSRSWSLSPEERLDRSETTSPLDSFLQKSVSSPIDFPPFRPTASSCLNADPGNCPFFIICIAFFRAISRSFFLSILSRMSSGILEGDRLQEREGLVSIRWSL